jgi:hypothetical protein
MNSFQLLPKNWFSSDYRVLRGGTQISEFTFHSMPEGSIFTLAAKTYLARKEKWSSPNFFLYMGQTQLARAEKPSAFSQTFTMEHDGNQYVLKRSGSNRFALRQQEKEVGWVAKQRWFSRKASAQLAIEMPLPVCVFVLWLVTLMWKRDADSDSTTMMMLASG